MALKVWTICDRCSFKYHRSQMHRESGGVVVCVRCFDGEYDKQKHPQNYPARDRINPSVVPNGRPSVELTNFLLLENGDTILAENGLKIVATGKVWTPGSYFGT